jgi:hypothetical protein
LGLSQSLWLNFSLYGPVPVLFKNKNNLQFCVLLLSDSGSGIQDPGWKKIWIRDVYPGSATLVCMYLRAEAKLASLYDAGEGKFAPMQGNMLLQPTPRRGLLVVHLHTANTLFSPFRKGMDRRH